MVKLREPTVADIETRAQALCEARPVIHIEPPDKHRDLTWAELDDSQRVGFRGWALAELREEMWLKLYEAAGWPSDEERTCSPKTMSFRVRVFRLNFPGWKEWKKRSAPGKLGRIA
jgi:hypothetical protein